MITIALRLVATLALSPSQRMVKGKAGSKARFQASDIAEIESGLDRLHTERILLGASITEQPNDALFFVDQQGIVDMKETKVLKEQGGLKNKPLKIDEILRPQSKVEAIGRRKQPSVGENKLLRRKIKALVSGTHPQPNLTKNSDVISDMWTDETTSTTLRRSDPKAKAIKVPNAGTSYRPTEEDHKRLMEMAAKVEIKKMRKNERLKRQIPSTLLRNKAISAMELAVREILVANNNVVQDETVNEDVEPSHPPIPKVANKKKTKLKRRREEKLRKIVKEQNAKKIEKKRAWELGSLRAIAKQVKKEIAERQKKRQTTKARLPNTIVPRSIEINLPEEIPDSLRTLKIEGNLVVDRFKSFQDRTLIGHMNNRNRPRKRKTWRRKVKMVEKFSHNGSL